MDKFVIGIDFGSDSVRALAVNTRTGEEAAGAVHYYSRWKEGLFCSPPENRFRQHPLDYLEGLEVTVKKTLKALPEEAEIAALSVDSTGSTPCAVDSQGIPLALTPGFEENPNAMFILWKDHTAIKEAEEITCLAHNWGGMDYTRFIGSVYSSEWFWAKMLHILRIDSKVRKAAYSWVEHCDWIPALLTGCQSADEIRRSRCAAGHKAMWHESFNGLPSEEFLTALDPLLKGVRGRLYRETNTADIPAGRLCAEWAEKLGLPEGIIIGTGAFDAHMGAIGAGITPYTLAKIIGTSTCDILTAPLKDVQGRLIRGICGQVEGSVIPGYEGLEAGQSAFGDVYAWYKNMLSWPLELDKTGSQTDLQKFTDKILPELTSAAEALPLTPNDPVAVDWLNGRRTPFADQRLKGGVLGLKLGTSAPSFFKALIEATAFGARKINNCFTDQGIAIKRVIAMGGVAKKSPYIMQVLSDVLNMPICVSKSEQTCALGAAICAAAAAGIYPDTNTAQKFMASPIEREYKPDPEKAKIYNLLFARYERFCRFIEEEEAL